MLVYLRRSICLNKDSVLLFWKLTALDGGLLVGMVDSLAMVPDAIFYGVRKILVYQRQKKFGISQPRPTLWLGKSVDKPAYPPPITHTSAVTSVSKGEYA
jgi:hypothetical protein